MLGVAEAIIKCQGAVTGVVKCPFCAKDHKHGLAEMKSLEGQWRSAHCRRGEYVIRTYPSAGNKQMTGGGF